MISSKAVALTDRTENGADGSAIPNVSGPRPSRSTPAKVRRGVGTSSFCE